MNKVTVVIPNWNGKEYLKKCLDSLMRQSIGQVPVIVVDNGSEDGSTETVKREYPWVHLICLDQNYGFCKAVNTGIQAVKTEYVILLNNDIVTDPDFVKYLLLRAESNSHLFSCQAKMLQMDCSDRIDKAGDEYILVMDGIHPVATCRLHQLDETTGKIERVATLEEYRGKHYGAEAIKAAEAWFAERGVKKILINSRTAVVGFYEKLGYTADPEQITGSGTFQCIMTEKTL